MKTTLRTLLLAATTLAAFPAFAKDDAVPAKPAAAPADAAPQKDFTVLKVGGDEIKNSEVVDLWKGLFPGGAAPDFNSFDEKVRQNVLRGVVSEHLIYQEALKAGTENDADVKQQIAAAQKQIVMKSFIEKKARDMVTDDQLKAAYAKKVADAKGQEEIKAKHILVPTEEEAKKIEDKLKKGEDFDTLAKEESTDKNSGANGGELGWFTKDKMVPEFAAAAFKLKKGEVSAPVKSEFGWHIIKVEDRRPVKVASFDDMKDSLKNELANKDVQDYVEGLLKKADVKYYDASGKEKPFSVSLAPDAAPKAEKKEEN